jgi:signal transduction histidine kinase
LERRDTSLTVDLPDALPPVYLNPGELSQVLYNLLQNARNHTRGGGVTVKAGTVNDGKHIEITVADTGEGIAPDLLPRVFERGVSGRGGAGSSGGGTGLGLAVCKEIIASYGGDINIESEPHKGTTVKFTLPVHKGE